MRLTIFAFIIAHLITMAVSQSVNAKNMLDQYQWNNRLILIFTPSLHDVNYQEQISILQENQEALTDRDIVLLEILTSNTDNIDENSPDKNHAHLIEEYNINQLFTVILVGKDGFEKRRESKPLSIDTLKDIIDAMPMRKREMNNELMLDNNVIKTL